MARARSAREPSRADARSAKAARKAGAHECVAARSGRNGRRAAAAARAPRSICCGCTSPGRRRGAWRRSPTSSGSARSTCGALPDRGHRPAGEPDARPRRSDPRHAHGGAAAAAAGEEDHRRLLQRRAGAGRPRPRAADAEAGEAARRPARSPRGGRDGTVCGSTSPGPRRARRARSRTRAEICDEHLPGRYELEVDRHLPAARAGQGRPDPRGADADQARCRCRSAHSSATCRIARACIGRPEAQAEAGRDAAQPAADRTTRRPLKLQVTRLKERAARGRGDARGHPPGPRRRAGRARPVGEQVFTLEGADHRYRQLVETMNEGALLLAGRRHHRLRQRALRRAGQARRSSGSSARRCARWRPPAWQRPARRRRAGGRGGASAKAEVELVGRRRRPRAGLPVGHRELGPATTP